MAQPYKMPPSWLLFVYRVPSEPSRNRVAVWRDMKRLGALYLQNCVCMLPNFRGMSAKLAKVTDKVAAMEGSCNVMEVKDMPKEQLADMVESFRSISDREYSEIIEECVTKFAKEIEFERFRKNFTYEEAEEIYADFEKIQAWLGRVVTRDWFGCPKRAEAEAHVAECEALFEAFERDCYSAAGETGELGKAPGDDHLIRTAARTNGSRRPKAKAKAR